MVCAGVRITRTGEEWAPSPGVTCSPDGTHGLHGKPVRWLRVETVSGGSSAWRVNVVIDRGRRCRHRGLFPLFSAPGHVGEERHPTGHVVERPAPPTYSSRRKNLLAQAHLDAHTRTLVRTCMPARTRSHTWHLDPACGVCAPGRGISWSPVLIYPQPPSRLPGQRTEVLDSDPAYLVAEMFIEMELVGN